MTEDQIERAVERMIDRLDREFLTKGGTNLEYDARIKDIEAWANRQYAGRKEVSL